MWGLTGGCGARWEEAERACNGANGHFKFYLHGWGPTAAWLEEEVSGARSCPYVDENSLACQGGAKG
eukprot:1155531-Pelagomonas_calceolata.AAC.3